MNAGDGEWEVQRVQLGSLDPYLLAFQRASVLKKMAKHWLARGKLGLALLENSSCFFGPSWKNKSFKKSSVLYSTSLLVRYSGSPACPVTPYKVLVRMYSAMPACPDIQCMSCLSGTVHRCLSGRTVPKLISEFFSAFRKLFARRATAAEF